MPESAGSQPLQDCSAFPGSSTPPLSPFLPSSPPSIDHEEKIWNANDIFISSDCLESSFSDSRPEDCNMPDYHQGAGIENHPDFHTKAKTVLEHIVDLDQPLHEKLLDVLLLKGTLPLLMDHITRIETRDHDGDTTDGQYPDIREQHWYGQVHKRLSRGACESPGMEESVALSRSWRLTKILCLRDGRDTVPRMSPNIRLWELKGDEILQALFQVFLTSSKGSLEHFSLVYESALMRDPRKIAAAVSNPQHGQNALIFRMLPYAIHPLISRCLLKTLSPPGLQTDDRYDHFQALSRLDVVGGILKMLRSDVPEVSEYVMDNISGLVHEFGRVPRILVALNSFEEDEMSTRVGLLKEMIQSGSWHQRRAAISVLYSLICRLPNQLPWPRRRKRITRQFSFGYAFDCPAPPLLLANYGERCTVARILDEPTNNVMDEYHAQNERFCDTMSYKCADILSDIVECLTNGPDRLTRPAFGESKPGLTVMLELVEILVATLQGQNSDTRLQDILSNLCRNSSLWSWVTQRFFDLPHVSIFQVNFYKLFVIGLRSLNESTLRILLGEFLPAILSRVDEPGLADLRPFMMLIGNTVRLASAPESQVYEKLAVHLESLKGWDEFRARVRSVAEEQILLPHAFCSGRPKPYPHCSPIPPGTPMPHRRQLQSWDSPHQDDPIEEMPVKSTAELLDHGSLYSSLLGFVNEDLLDMDDDDEEEEERGEDSVMADSPGTVSQAPLGPPGVGGSPELERPKESQLEAGGEWGLGVFPPAEGTGAPTIAKASNATPIMDMSYSTARKDDESPDPYANQAEP